MAEPNEQRSGVLSAARTEAFQQARTTNVLKTVLLIIVVVAAVTLGARYVATRSIGPTSSQGVANEAAIRHKIIDLEKQIADLKTDMEITKKPNLFVRVVQFIATFAVSNWVLLSFVVALLTAIYVKIKFNIDYFESYRDVATKKMLSEFYRILGDRMMVWNEWNAAEAAYRDSLAINPTNIEATYGIAKVSVFQPLRGETVFAPEVADMKLDYLIENPPPNARPEDLRRHFGQLYYLQGLSRSAVGDEIEDRTCQERAIKIDPNFVGPYIRLGYLHESAGEIDEAVKCYKKAIDLEPNLAVTNTTLGGVYLMTGAFDEAIKYLERARKLSPLLLTTLMLGEAYAYTGRFTQALGWHESALSTITTPGMERERYVTYGGIWLYSFMPLHKGDMDTIKGYVTIDTFEQKKLLTLYLLGLDHGLLGNILRANERFAEAHAIKDTDDFAAFLLNRIGSILDFVDLEPDVRSWFEGKRQELSVSGKPPRP